MEDKDAEYANRLIRQVFTDLEDAVLNADRVSDSRAELQDIQSRKEEHIKRERRILDDVRGVLDSYSKEEDIEFFKPVHASIQTLVGSALDPYEKSLVEYLDRDVKAKEEEIDSYRAKGMRALETFLSRDHLDPIESEISLRYVEGGYEARYRCTCQKELEYEFMLNASEVDFLKTQSEGSALAKGIRLPVRFAKTWVSKEPAIDYEKLDTYYISQASTSDSNLFLTMVSEETGAEFKFHSSASDGTAFLEIDYKDSLQNITITSQPALNANINREEVMQFLEEVRSAMVFLKGHKLRMSRLLLRDVDVMATMKITDAFYTILEILSPKISEAISSILTGKAAVDLKDEKAVTREFIESRLQLLGDRAQTVSAILGITGFTDSMSGSR